jgi:hypothetical protein
MTYLTFEFEHRGSLFDLILKLVQINFIFADTVRKLYIHYHLRICIETDLNYNYMLLFELTVDKENYSSSTITAYLN